jgi:hypothetical protein
VGDEVEGYQLVAIGRRQRDGEVVHVDVGLGVAVAGQKGQALRHRRRQAGCEPPVDIPTGGLDHDDGPLQSLLLVERPVPGGGHRQPLVLEIGEGGEAAGQPLDPCSETLDGGGRGGGALLGCHRLPLKSRQAGGVGRKVADGLLGVAPTASEVGHQLDPLMGERLDVGATEALAAARLGQAGGQAVVLVPVAAGVAERRHRLERGQPGVEAPSRGGPADPGLHGLSGGTVAGRLVAQLGVLRLTIGEAGVLDLQLPPPNREPGCLIDGRQRGGRRLEQHLDPAAGGRPCGRAQTRLTGQGQTAVDRRLQLLTGAHLLGAVNLDDGGLLPALRLEAACRRQAGSEPLQT